jgi:hypothetical protein
LARQLERFDNLVSLFLTRAQEKGDAQFLWAKREGSWRSISWTEAARHCRIRYGGSAFSRAIASRWSARTGPNG